MALCVVGLTLLALRGRLGIGGRLGVGVRLGLWPGGLCVVDGGWGLVPFQLLLLDELLVVTVILGPGATFHHGDAPVNALGHTLFGGSVQPLDNLLSLGLGRGAALFLQGRLGRLIQPEAFSVLGGLHHEVGKLFQTFPGHLLVQLIRLCQAGLLLHLLSLGPGLCPSQCWGHGRSR